MGCESKIGKDIISTCETQTIGGLEIVAYILSRTDFDPTVDPTQSNLLTAVSMASGTQAYKITGVNKNLNAGFDRVTSDDLADTFTHYFSLKGFEFDAASVENFDNMRDVVVITETRNKVDDADGVFRAYGVGAGLFPSSDTQRMNDANGIRSIELTSKDQQTEKHSQFNVLDTDYATTKTALEALLIPAV